MGCKWLLASENIENILTSRAYLDKSSSHFTATNADATSLLTDMKLLCRLQPITLMFIRSPFKSVQYAWVLVSKYIAKSFRNGPITIFSNIHYINIHYVHIKKFILHGYRHWLGDMAKTIITKNVKSLFLSSLKADFCS